MPYHPCVRTLRSSGLLAAALLIAACSQGDVGGPHDLIGIAAAQALAEAEPIELAVPGSAVALRFVPVLHRAELLWVSETEVPWEVFDAFYLRPVEVPGADAISAPSRFLIPVTRGFGHDGFPALGMTFHAAEQLCAWLSAATDSVVRLPTVAEWRSACGASTDRLPERAWYAANADGEPHAVGSLAPNRFGLYDMLGNLAEWCVAEDGTGVVCGGHYLASAEDTTFTTSLPYDASWQQSDPQWPKSAWWLSDCALTGIRLVLMR